MLGIGENIGNISSFKNVKKKLKEKMIKRKGG